MHPRGLRLLADVIGRPVLIIFENCGDWGSFKGLEKPNVTNMFNKGKQEGLGNYRTAYHTLIAVIVLGQITLESFPNILLCFRHFPILCRRMQNIFWLFLVRYTGFHVYSAGAVLGSVILLSFSATS